ncbi:MAG: hypothetical protein O9262_07085 [Cyclobacteriaceae bacterium]|nr:hypothetical protein [Cyclobacteriaceae bacterium]
MRNQFLLFVLLILFLSNCDERVEKNEIDTDNSLFTRSVGGSISPEVAARWVERRRSHTSVREQNFNVTADKLNALLDQVDDKLGVILHHAQGPDGERHLFITPVKSDLQSWSNGSVLDAATNEFTDASQAKNWVLDYKEQHPDGPWSQFYGIDLFDEIRAIEDLNRLEIIEGEDESGKFQTLLYAWANDLKSGRTQEQLSVFDISLHCPSACPEEY